MARRMFRTGNSSVGSIPPDVQGAVGLGPGDDIAVVGDPELRQIAITPAAQLPGVNTDLLDRVDRFVERHRLALETLARN